MVAGMRVFFNELCVGTIVKVDDEAVTCSWGYGEPDVCRWDEINTKATRLRLQHWLEETE